ncbi:MAG: signal peptidase I [Alphaproteobacteria bacterium 43-37]|nr:MAG: signal peptidase I [Alphaproteobacteria bacterium 43-37]
MASKSKQPKKQESVKEFLMSILWILVAVVTIRSFVFESYKIPSGSMYPTNYIGDFLFVSKFPYGISHYSFPFSPKIFSGRIFGGMPKQGDVVVFRPPSDTSIDYIKRVVGTPGDRVQMRAGVLHINGQPVKLERIEDFILEEKGGAKKYAQYIETLPNGVSHKILKQFPMGLAPADDTVEFVVPEGHFFAMGDNRDNSKDSRWINDIGYIPLENAVGRAELTYFSIDRNIAEHFWEFWHWPQAIRFKRMFGLIR